MSDSRDERWLGNVIRNAKTLDEAKLAVSVFLAERQRIPLRLPEDGPMLRLIVSETLRDNSQVVRKSGKASKAD